MSEREIRAFDYVNQPYEQVRDAIRKDAAAMFASATKVAEARTGELVTSLSVDIKGIEVTKEITIRLGDIREEPGPRPRSPDEPARSPPPPNPGRLWLGSATTLRCRR